MPRIEARAAGVGFHTMASSDRAYDIVLLGASGFVGRFTAAHLARSAPDGVRIAVAGRSRERLEAVRDDLGVDWPIIEVDTSDEGGVEALAAATRVVATTVGPYLRYGVGVVAACARAGTSYADLSGESAFVARSIRDNHDAAGSTGARIVHSCGFDSVPSDLGLGLAHAAAGGGPIAEAVLRVRSARGGISGGTLDSLRQQLLESRTDAGIRRIMANPYALTPGPSARLPYRAGGAVLKDRASRWQAPFIMGGYNQQIVQRSNFLTGWGYGQLMRYREVVDTGRGVRAALTARAIAGGSAALFGALSFAPSRAVVDRFLPSPGEGPDDEAIAHGRFAIEVDAYPVTGAPVRTTFSAPFDPGYGGTGVMLGESALSLALDDLPEHAGVLTPMVAMGEALAARLRSHDFTIDVGPLE